MMKLNLTFKTPDVLYQAAEQYVDASPSDCEEDEDENPYLVEEALETVTELLSEWVRWGEYIDVEFDTDTKTVRVLTVAEAES